MKIDKMVFLDSNYSYLMYRMSDYYSSSDMVICSDGLSDIVRGKIPKKKYLPIKKLGLVGRLKLFFSLLFLLVKVQRFKGTILGQDHLFFSFCFYRKKYILVEDGLVNYLPPRSKNFFNKVKSYLINGELYGYNKYCTGLVLSGKENIPTSLVHKVTICKLDDVWEKKSEEEREEILSAFSVSKVDYKFQDSVVVLTQPFSEDGAISEKYKIDLYSRVIAHYFDDKTLIYIKPHPREVTDYLTLMERKVELIERHVPFELIMLIRPKIKVLTFFSTSALSEENATFLGTEFDEKLRNHYGPIKSNF
ncbi:glycosyltransferase family 52 [Vibrio sp. 1S139]|uniref:glycosyltransferase family 52 n=1 Tax=Vibrio sp. 1S139 TaxID=3230006 RepID=UPI00352D8B64